MVISVDVNFGINVTEYGMATVTFPKACQVLQIKLVM